MGRVAARAVARGQPPAVRAVSGVASGVADAVLAVDQGVLNVLLPIVRIPVPESARIEPEEGIVREEQRAAEVRSERQPDIVAGPVVAERQALHPATVIGRGGDRVGRRRRGQDIRSEEHTSELQSLMRISYAVFCLKKK